MEAQMTRVLVTPTIAEDFLRSNYAQQRRVNETWVKTLADQMKNDLWNEDIVNPIHFSKTGALLDGQHRLQAVINSGVTIRMWVVKGEDESTFNYLDGGKPRTADQFVTVENAKAVSSLARRIKGLENGAPLDSVVQGNLGRFNPSRITIINASNEDADIQYAARAGKKMREKVGAGSATAMGLLVYYLKKLDKEGADAFVTGFCEDLSEDSELIFIRTRDYMQKKMLAKAKGTTNQKWLFSTLLISYQCFVTGKESSPFNYQESAFAKFESEVSDFYNTKGVSNNA